MRNVAAVADCDEVVEADSLTTCTRDAAVKLRMADSGPLSIKPVCVMTALRTTADRYPSQPALGLCLMLLAATVSKSCISAITVVVTRCWTCNQQVVSSISIGTKLLNNLVQVAHTYVPQSPSSITLYWSKDGDVLWLGKWPQAWQKVMAAFRWGMTLKVTCGLTASTPGSPPGLSLSNEYGRTLHYLSCSVCRKLKQVLVTLLELQKYLTNFTA